MLKAHIHILVLCLHVDQKGAMHSAAARVGHSVGTAQVNL